MIGEMELGFDRCYEATRSRDPRFDGWFIVGVRTTGIYCRPSCPSPVCPKPVNITFYRTAAAAQLAGLRACKRCHPDAVPGSPEWNVRADVVGRAMRLIADGVVDREGVPGLARRLSISVRHLHRTLVDAVGAPPLALARSQRAYQARLLIEGTAMPLSEVAFAAGFASIRQFNETIRAVFDVTPSRLRSTARPHPGGGLTLRLALRRPYDVGGVLGWLAARAIPGVEELADGAYRRVLRLPGGPGTVALRPADDHVSATFRLTTMADLGTAVARCRRLLDLDADPGGYLPTLAADPALAPLAGAVPGLRLPGPVDGPEAAMRFLLGPAAGRLVEPLSTPDGGLTHMFASPAALAERAEADGRAEGEGRAEGDGRAGGDGRDGCVGGAEWDEKAERDVLGGRGLSGPAGELARLVAGGEIRLDEGADRAAVRRRLLAIRGLGPAEVEGLMLHALGDPDAFPGNDRGLRAAAGRHGLPGGGDGLARRAEAWRPWRGYAAHLLWRAGQPTTTTKVPRAVPPW